MYTPDCPNTNNLCRLRFFSFLSILNCKSILLHAVPITRPRPCEELIKALGSVLYHAFFSVQLFFVVTAVIG